MMFYLRDDIDDAVLILNFQSGHINFFLPDHTAKTLNVKEKGWKWVSFHFFSLNYNGGRTRPLCFLLLFLESLLFLNMIFVNIIVHQFRWFSSLPC